MSLTNRPAEQEANLIEEFWDKIQERGVPFERVSPLKSFIRNGGNDAIDYGLLFHRGPNQVAHDLLEGGYASVERPLREDGFQRFVLENDIRDLETDAASTAISEETFLDVLRDEKSKS